MFKWIEKKTGFPFPILMILLFAIGGMVFFMFLVSWTVIEQIPNGYVLPQWMIIPSSVPLLIAILMLLYLRYVENPTNR